MIVIFKPLMDSSIRPVKKFRASVSMDVINWRGRSSKDESLKSRIGLMKKFLAFRAFLNSYN